jgi:hypothetical protein
MEFSLAIDCDNAAFENPRAEIARILRELADDLEICEYSMFRLSDINGNNVGRAKLIGE